jgi:hypothetical protein
VSEPVAVTCAVASPARSGAAPPTGSACIQPPRLTREIAAAWSYCIQPPRLARETVVTGQAVRICGSR